MSTHVVLRRAYTYKKGLARKLNRKCPLQHTATHCNTRKDLQDSLIANEHCNTPQHTATHCNTRKDLQDSLIANAHCNPLQHSKKIAR